MSPLKRLPGVLSAAVVSLVILTTMASVAAAEPASAQVQSPAVNVESLAAAQGLPGAPPNSLNDEILRWTYYLQQVIRQLSPGAPTPISRLTAMMYGATYDAVNSLDNIGTPYLGKVLVIPGCSFNRPQCLAAAVNSAAANTLTNALSTSQPNVVGYVQAAQQAESARIGLGLAAGVGSTAGILSAVQMTNARANDGSTNNQPYTPGSEPGAWRPTGNGCTTAVTPNWGLVKPFALTSGSQFRPPRPGGFASYPALLSSSLYAAQVNEVQSLGRFDSATRTPDQTEAALFWSNDVDGTYKPPGQHLDHTRIISQQRGLTLQQNARLFGLLGLALADSGITAWDSKYDTQIDLWRPETAIKLASTDNNPATTADPGWQPFLSNRAGDTHFSPCFPAYTSGHATFGGTWAKVMQLYFGTDAITFTATTDDPHAQGVTRTFTSLDTAATEDAISRVYLDVHYRFDADFGLSSGKSVANYIFNTQLRPI
jgi:PAP2 superfamily